MLAVHRVMIHTAGSPPGTLRRYEGQLGGCITPSPAHATLATVRVAIPTSCDGEARRIRRLRCAETLRCAEMVRLVPETRARVLIDALLHAGNHTALGRAARGRCGDLYYARERWPRAGCPGTLGWPRRGPVEPARRG